VDGQLLVHRFSPGRHLLVHRFVTGRHILVLRFVLDRHLLVQTTPRNVQKNLLLTGEIKFS
jgi:hypothetical protein